MRLLTMIAALVLMLTGSAWAAERGGEGGGRGHSGHIRGGHHGRHHNDSSAEPTQDEPNADDSYAAAEYGKHIGPDTPVPETPREAKMRGHQTGDTHRK